MEKNQILQFLEAFKKTEKTKLDLSNKGIKEIPDEISEMQHIEHINLSYNDISKLPDGLFKLSNLKSLLITRNSITEIPPAIQELKKLEYIDISYNKLEIIPDEIGNLESLITFDGSFNRLKSLPVEMINLLSLRKLYLEENAFEFPPENVVKRGLYATMIYLAHIKKKRDSTRIFVQIFNMPEEAKNMFEQYISNFQNMVSGELEYRIKFDISYIEKDKTITTQRKT